MSETPARFEFRAFAQDFGLVEERLRPAAEEPGRCRESQELYLLSPANAWANTKVRDGQLDIKTLVTHEGRLEQWRPESKEPFPLPRSFVEQTLCPALRTDPPHLTRPHYTLAQLLDEVVDTHDRLTAAHVYKQRITYKIGDCIAELSRVLVNGALVRTTSLESADAEALLALGERCGLLEYENVNYLLAIKRIIGMTPLPVDAYYRTTE